MRERIAIAAIGYVISGLGFGLLVWSDSGNVAKGLIVGVLTGALFTASMMIFGFLVGRARMLGASAPSGWADSETIVKLGQANVIRSGWSLGGMLYLTERRLRFCGHRLNFDVVDYSFLLSDLQSLGAVRLGILPNGLIIRLKDGRHVKFAVYGRSDWETAIKHQANL